MKRSFFVILLLLLAACTAAPQETGTLTGHVSIGPLAPVQREGVPEPTPAPEVYAARQVVVYAADGETEVARASIGPDGEYEVTLPVGVYWVDIARTGIDRGIGLPQKVEIVSGEVTRLDIDIDTGIR